MATPTHVPVLVREVMGLFAPRPGDRLLDATLGLGGHAREYLRATAPSGTVVGLDADQHALAQAKKNLAVYRDRLITLHSNFADLNNAVIGGGMVERGNGTLHNTPPENIPRFNHILFDLGVGSHQLGDEKRGFSFTATGSLTMRYGNIRELPPAKIAALNIIADRLGDPPDVPELLAYLREEELAEVLYVYGEERYRGRIAQALKEEPLPATPRELAERVAQAVPGRYRHGRIHPATRTFQALRLAVNRELEALETALPQAFTLLAPGGTLVVISFHSLEDRIVKHSFRQQAKTGDYVVLTKKPMIALDDEVRSNPRSRSAKLRAIRKKE